MREPAKAKRWSVSVALQPERTRELILEFDLPFEASEGGGDSDLVQEIANGIRLARAAGWEPESRGRAFRFALGD